MRRSRDAARRALGWVVVVAAAPAWASESGELAKAPAAVTEVEDPNDPKTMASLRRPLFVPSASALALGVAALVGGLVGGAWLGRRSERAGQGDGRG